MSPAVPQISIITATRNAGRYLARCRDSILSQTYANWEWLVQDALSTDATLEILKSVRDPRLSVVSEPDSGVYDAWNKALARSSGDWLIFLGADDFLFGSDVLALCAEYLRTLPPQIVFAYGALFFVEDAQKIRLTINRPLDAVYQAMPFNQGLPFPATFIRGDAARAAGFDASYRIAGDYAFAARLIAPGNVIRLPFYITGMQRGGLSDSPEYAGKCMDERRRVIRDIAYPRADAFLQGAYEHLENTDVSCLNRRDFRRFRKRHRKKLFWSRLLAKLRPGGA